jgi:hypothetical protein
VSRIKLFSRPTKISDINQEELYDIAEDDQWKVKAERLQERRWKVLQDRETMSKFFRSSRSPRLRHSLS